MPYRKTETVLRRLAGKRDSILKAAIDLADRDGIDGFTIEDLANRARVAVGTIYLHFPNRHEIDAAIIADLLAHDVKRIGFAADTQESPVESLAAAVSVYVNLFGSRKKLGPSLARDLIYRTGITQEFARKIAAAISRKDIPSGDSSVLAAAVYGAINEVLAIRGRKDENSERSLVILTLRAIGVDHRRAESIASHQLEHSTVP